VAKLTSSTSKETSSKRGTKNRPSDVSSLQNLETILELMAKHDVAELDWNKGGERLKLKTRHAFTEQAMAAVQSQAGLVGYRHPMESFVPIERAVTSPTSASGAVVEPAVGASKSATLNQNQKQVVSPFVGTFYRSPSPEAEPYVREGQSIKRGDPLCIVEAMKLMNEIEAEFPGKIVSILVENGQPVEFGEPLFVIEP
jgi:acetyl-CoA carboxylase biotin carboxyl carrier protein